MVLKRVVFHICFRKTPWARVKAKSQDFTHNAEFEVDSAAGRYRLYRVQIHVFFN